VLFRLHAVVISSFEGTVAAAKEAGPEFEDFFRDEYVRLAKAIYLLTGNNSEAEDLAEEAMFRVFVRWDQVRAMASPTGYLYRTALNLARRRFRHRRKEASLEHVPLQDLHDRVERRVMVRRAVRTLSQDQREAIILTDWLDLSAAEVGSILGITAEAVRARTHRAREALRSLIGGIDG
jgi:RNA polymerase sigma factor (sigma-70 family)